MYGDQFGEFVRGYWGYKGLSIPAKSYVLGSLLRKGLCVIGRLGKMENEALFP